MKLEQYQADVKKSYTTRMMKDELRGMTLGYIPQKPQLAKRYMPINKDGSTNVEQAIKFLGCIYGFNTLEGFCKLAGWSTYQQILLEDYIEDEWE